MNIPENALLHKELLAELQKKCPLIHWNVDIMTYFAEPKDLILGMNPPEGTRLYYYIRGVIYCNLGYFTISCALSGIELHSTRLSLSDLVDQEINLMLGQLITAIKTWRPSE